MKEQRADPTPQIRASPVFWDTEASSRAHSNELGTNQAKRGYPTLDEAIRQVFSLSRLMRQHKGVFMFLCKSALRIRMVLVFVPALFIGCGGGASISSPSPTPVLTPRFAFVANFASGDVSAFTINASTGALTAVGSPVAVGTNPISIAVDPGGRFDYVANATSNDISAF